MEATSGGKKIGESSGIQSQKQQLSLKMKEIEIKHPSMEDTPGCKTKEEEEFLNQHISARVKAEITSDGTPKGMKKANSLRVAAESRDPGGIMPVVILHGNNS